MLMQYVIQVLRNTHDGYGRANDKRAESEETYYEQLVKEAMSYLNKKAGITENYFVIRKCGTFGVTSDIVEASNAGLYQMKE